MILTVTPNFAVDVTYRVDQVRVGETTAVGSVFRQAGGKGVNAARTLQALGREVLVTGFAGGVTGEAARAELSASGLEDETVQVAGSSRTTLIIVDEDGEATGFSEPGPEVSADEWASLVARVRSLLPRSQAVVLAGSLPPGAPIDGYGELISIAAPTGIPLLLDTHGDAVLHAVAAHPTIVKMNASELAGTVGESEIIVGARALRERGAEAVVVSDGANGLVAISEHGIWQAKPPRRLRGNPTGAGDAASAALIAGVVDGQNWPELIADATALSAAAVCAPIAGSFDEGVYRRLREEIVAVELPVPR
ncbi:MAG: 1-phosphofructokinase family hexose kinase [Solirubrobacterales bacterium]|nr:1-phosphofructokinase family hexose kinase [Solirubrobacterales bacterium]